MTPRAAFPAALGLAAALIAHPAAAAVIPDPASNKTLAIHDLSGQVIEMLLPQRDHYDIVDRRRPWVRIGYTKRTGNELVLYNLNNRVTGYIRPELLPPDAELSAIATVRDPEGNLIGLLSRF